MNQLTYVIKNREVATALFFCAFWKEGPDFHAVNMEKF